MFICSFFHKKNEKERAKADGTSGDGKDGTLGG